MTTKARDHLKTIHPTHLHLAAHYNAVENRETDVNSVHFFGSLKSSKKLGHESFLRVPITHVQTDYLSDPPSFA